ncbi:MAG: hypothetical protein AB9Q20_11110 [Candidatus Reddybacter sp.]
MTILTPPHFSECKALGGHYYFSAWITFIGYTTGYISKAQLALQYIGLSIKAVPIRGHFPSFQLSLKDPKIGSLDFLDSLFFGGESIFGDYKSHSLLHIIYFQCTDSFIAFLV